MHRDVRCSVQVLSYAPGAAAWVAGARAVIAPHATGAAYQNYADRSITDWRRAYYGPAYGRLLATKRASTPTTASASCSPSAADPAVRRHEHGRRGQRARQQPELGGADHGLGP